MNSYSTLSHQYIYQLLQSKYVCQSLRVQLRVAGYALALWKIFHKVILACSRQFDLTYLYLLALNLSPASGSRTFYSIALSQLAFSSNSRPTCTLDTFTTTRGLYLLR